MSYTVIWLNSAERELARLWLDAAARDEISAAAFEIDRLLRDDPEGQGESRSKTGRILFVHPLAILCEVVKDDRKVFVQHIWRFGRRSQRD